MIPLLIDRRGPMTAGGERLSSLLALPLGRYTLLEHLTGALAEVTREPVTILPTFDPDRDYASTLSRLDRITVLERDELGAWISSKEPSDRVMVLDVAGLPSESFDFLSALDRVGEYRGVVHCVAVNTSDGATHECIERDDDGRVRRIQRYISAVSWPALANTSLFMAILPAGAMRGLTFTSLAELRVASNRRGTLTRDEPFDIDIIDLEHEAGLLAFNEHLLASALGESWRGFRRHDHNVLIGKGTKIHDTARLIGPVVVQDDVTIGARCTVVGPTVIGAASAIGEGATIAQAVLARGTCVAPGTLIRQQVASGTCDRSTTRSAFGAEAAVALQRVDQRLTRAHHGGEVSPRKPASHTLQHRLKRAFDIAFSAVALLLLSPLMVLVAILVKLTSSGPVFFVHRREQRGGTEFECMKFRTMVADAHERQRELYDASEVDGPQFKMVNDPRVTPIGRFLRATNIDELPQLINVLRGDMSMVGPRPSPFRENQVCVPWRRARLSVRPGITGLWQVCRSEDRSRGDFHEWIFYDITYVRHFSIWLDIKIFVATVVTFGGRWSVPLSWVVPAARDHTGTPAAPVSSA